MSQSAILIGATGLIGGHILQILLSDDRFSRLRILVRKPFDVSHPKLQVHVVDFSNENDFRERLGSADTIFCAIGTTQQKVKGDKGAYERIDYAIPYTAAMFGKDAGVRKFLLVSSVGADPGSGNFYLQLKGKTEKAIKTCGIKSIHFFRPSILLGERRESRPGESIGKVLMQTFSFALAGNLKKYKPVHAKTVAKAMVNASFNEEKGVFVYEYGQIKQLARE